MTVFTIGYEGLSIEQFVDKIKEYGINSVVDVREYPISRKKGFSKTKLSEVLHENDIEYYHFRKLGSPKKIRDELRKTKNYFKFFMEYESYLNTLEDDTLENVTSISKNEKTCLMCYEHDSNHCHRKIVAKHISKLTNGDIVIKHIK